MKGYALLNISLRYLPIIVALIGAGISVYTDVKWGKIKNFVTIPSILIGWSWAFFAGWKVALMNILISCVIGGMSCMVGKVGSGDVKLITGVAACLGPVLGLLFIAFFFMALAVTAVAVRLKAHGFQIKSALKAMKAEAVMEVSGIRDASAIAHGGKMSHIGAPVIFAALVLCLIRAKAVGLI